MNPRARFDSIGRISPCATSSLAIRKLSTAPGADPEGSRRRTRASQVRALRVGPERLLGTATPRGFIHGYLCREHKGFSKPNSASPLPIDSGVRAVATKTDNPPNP